MTWSGWVVVWRRCGGAGDQAAWLGGRAVHGSRRPSCGPSEPARAAGGAVPCNGHVSFVKHL